MTGTGQMGGPSVRWTVSPRPVWAPGRVRLAVSPGPAPVVAVHDPGSPQAERDLWLRAAQHSWGAWVYSQRGHAPSGWAAGGLYRASDLAIDLIRLLRDLVAQPCLLAGQGAGGLIAMLAAAAAPDLVTGLHVAAADGSEGWGTDAGLLVSHLGVLNRRWLAAARSGSVPAREDRDDPVLACGPAERMHAPAVAAAAGRVRVPWSVWGGHFLQAWLPPSMQARAPLLQPLIPMAAGAAQHEAPL